MAMKNLQGLGGYKSVSYKDLCMFLGVNLSLVFKMPKFEKYDGHGNPIAHLRHYFNQLRGAGGKKELLMAYFGESLLGLASKWFVDQDINKWDSWNDLANEFSQQFQDNMELIPDEKSLTNMKKKKSTVRVKPPIKESKMVEVFVQAQDEIYYQHLLSALGKPFIEILKIREMIEDGIKTVRIVSFATLKATTQAIQKGPGNVGGNKNKEDVADIIVGQWSCPKRSRCHYPQAQAQVHTQAPRNHSQNLLYSIPPPSYPVYNAQPHVQSPSYAKWHTPTLQSHPPTLQTYSKANNKMRPKSRDSFTPFGESYANLFQRLGHSIEDCHILERNREDDSR
ncbi:putative nitrate transporter 1.4-like [Capsicum annuum]|uniref:Retrotransposon gag domain-containing protein n=1 Tax=Capsicum annuum TaxID=4072 RepID=A0A2G2ZXA8_CAPAN|nr:putative nitrate transporter 1.4-like [Capsicum annuum]PHT86623.1 hypothetical protein T459_08729 [Capsicum annuum]